VSEINTGYIAAADAFIGQDRVASVSANPDVKHFDKDTIKIWDVETGRLIRQISSEPGVSTTLCWCPMADGFARHVGLDKHVGPWWMIERNNVTVYRRFAFGISVRMRCLLFSRSTFTGGLRLCAECKGRRCARLPRCTGGALHFYEVR